MHSEITNNKPERWVTRIAAIGLGLGLCMSLIYVIISPKLLDDIVIDSLAEFAIWDTLLVLAFITSMSFVYVGVKGRLPKYFEEWAKLDSQKQLEDTKIFRIVYMCVFLLPFFCGALGIQITWGILENTIDIDKLLSISILIGVSSVLLLKLFEPLLHIKNAERWPLRAMFAVGVMTCSAAIIGYSNLRLSTNEIVVQKIPVLEKRHSSQNNQWRLLIVIYGRRNWVLVNRNCWRDAVEGESVQLMVQEGYWGMPMVRIKHA